MRAARGLPSQGPGRLDRFLVGRASRRGHDGCLRSAARAHSAVRSCRRDPACDRYVRHEPQARRAVARPARLPGTRPRGKRIHAIRGRRRDASLSRGRFRRTGLRARMDDACDRASCAQARPLRFALRVGSRPAARRRKASAQALKRRYSLGRRRRRRDRSVEKIALHHLAEVSQTRVQVGRRSILKRLLADLFQGSFINYFSSCASAKIAWHRRSIRSRSCLCQARSRGRRPGICDTRLPFRFYGGPLYDANREQLAKNARLIKQNNITPE